VLISGIERAQADIIYSIMELISSDKQCPDIPHYPDAARPPEASATLHRRDVVDRIGFWKAPQEVRAIPRVAFFRKAQFSGMKFALAPHLTVLKFSRSDSGYGESSLQAQYVEKITRDPDFASKELAKMLIEANRKSEGPLSLGQLSNQLQQSMRLLLVKLRIDPGIMRPWLKPGDRINNWRKSHGLDPK
jgi:hypothetical protein